MTDTHPGLYSTTPSRKSNDNGICSFFYVGEDNILAASYGKYVKQVSKSTHLLPFFGTDYGLCSLIKPQITFNVSLEKLPFDTLMKNYSSKIQPGDYFSHVRNCMFSHMMRLLLLPPQDDEINLSNSLRAMFCNLRKLNYALFDLMQEFNLEKGTCVTFSFLHGQGKTVMVV